MSIPFPMYEINNLEAYFRFIINKLNFFNVIYWLLGSGSKYKQATSRYLRKDGICKPIRK